MSDIPERGSQLHIYFIAGAHGSGKSTLCSELSVRLGIPWASAGQLIRGVSESSQSEGKKVGDVSGNQDLLVAALEDCRPSGGELLLDGHFCLFNKNGDVVRVPFETLAGIDPVAVVLLHTDSSELRRRLEARDKTVYDTVDLRLLVQEEEAYCREVCAELACALLVCSRAAEIEIVEQFVRDHRKGSSG